MERNLLIVRIDQIARNDDLQAKLRASEWDLIVVNEAHKMAARYYGSKLEKTKRYQVGEQLRGITRHFSGANVIVSRQERATGRSRRRSRCGSQRFPTPKPKAS